MKKRRASILTVTWLACAVFFLVAANPAYSEPVATIGHCGVLDFKDVESVTFGPGQMFKAQCEVTISGVEGPYVRVDNYYYVEKLDEVYTDYFYLGNETRTLYSTWFRLPINSYPHGEAFSIYFDSTPYGGSRAETDLPFTMSRDALVNSTGAYQLTVSPHPTAVDLSQFILDHCISAKTSLQGSPLQYASWVEDSKTKSDFLLSLEAYRPSVLLIHAKMNQTRIYFPDDTSIDKDDLTNYGYCYPEYAVGSGLVFLASGESAYGAGNLTVPFRECGYTAVIGFDSSYPYQYHIAAFYEQFFKEAVEPDVSVAEALDKTKAWAMAINTGWSDVAGSYSGARLVGDGTILYLGGGPEPSSAALRRNRQAREEGTTYEPQPERQDPWRGQASSRLSKGERRAIRKAGRVEVVRQLRERYGAALRIGVVRYPHLHRVVYKVGEEAVYGVDVHARTFEIIDQGEI
jgi:hypothetical protein